MHSSVFEGAPRGFAVPTASRRQITRALVLALTLLGAIPAGAATLPGFMPMVTDSAAVFAIPRVSEPAYLVPTRDPVFGTWVMRVAGDMGRPIPSLGGIWEGIARHVYSKQQPWNSTGSLVTIENRVGSTTPVILDGQTFQPRFGPCSNYDRWDYRWHPGATHPNEQINVNGAGTELMWFDVLNCSKTRSWRLPLVANYGIGSGEGNVSADGRFVAIANQDSIVVVDMDPKSPNAPPYPYRRIGPVYAFPPCSLDVNQARNCPVDNVSISPSGRYIDVKYGAVNLAGASGCDTLCDMHRIFEVDSNLTIRPHAMATGAMRCGSFAARPNGWIFPLKHSDMAFDPFDGNEDVLMGGRACPGSTLGHVVKVRLRDGQVTSLTDPANEPSYSHGSARNSSRPGWFYVTYSRDPVYTGYRFRGEVVAVKMDGSGSVQRFAHYHSTQLTYDSEAQAVPSPDGRMVLMASDWSDACAPPCGVGAVVRDYVVMASETGPVGMPPSAAAEGLVLMPPGPNPSPGGFRVSFTLPSSGPAALELFDVAGRRLAFRDVGAMGAGTHQVDLDEGHRLVPGIYLIALTDGHERKAVHAVVIR